MSINHTPLGQLEGGQIGQIVAQLVKNLPAMQEMGFNPWVEEIPWRRKWQHTPLFLPR